MSFGRGYCDVCGVEFIKRGRDHLCTAHMEGYDRAIDDVTEWLRVKGHDDIADSVWPECVQVYESVLLEDRCHIEIGKSRPAKSVKVKP